MVGIGTSIGLCRVNPEVVLVQQVFILTRNRPLNGVKVYVHDTREECNLPIKCYLTQMQGTKVLHSSCRESTETQSDATLLKERKGVEHKVFSHVYILVWENLTKGQTKGLSNQARNGQGMDSSPKGVGTIQFSWVLETECLLY